MKEQSTFQTLILVGFVAVGLIGVGMFALMQAGGEGSISVTVWGTLPQQTVSSVVHDAPSLEDITVSYVEKNEDRLYTDLLEAIASGRGPDLLLLSSRHLETFKDKLYQIPYASISARDFQDTYIDGAQIFTDESGIYGLPLYVDPLVLYWNRDMLRTARIASPPQYWDNLGGLVSAVTVTDEDRTITESAIPLGEYRNVTRAYETLATLFLQYGVSIYEEGREGLMPRFAGNTGASVLSFYTSFSDPTRATYTWNRSLPTSRDMFIAGDLLFYPGKASELRLLRDTNPNLNFDVAEMMQPRESTRPITYGDIGAVSILRTSRNIQDAFTVAYLLAGQGVAEGLTERTFLPPARRSILNASPEDAAQEFLYSSALITESFPDPSVTLTDSIFQEMIENVTAGRYNAQEALRRAEEKITSELR